MKKKLSATLIIALCILVFASAGNNEMENDGIIYESGCYAYKDWEKKRHTYDDAIIPDEKSALEVAKAIYYNLDNVYDKYDREPFYVFYDEIDEMWIVSFKQI